MRQAARPERSGGLEERVPFGRDANNVGSDESAEDAATVATATLVKPSQPTEPNGAPPPPDEEGYVWPEGSAPSEIAVPTSPASENEPETPLPTLDELVKRIPPATRETLDELFRVKFVSVKRVSSSSLKS